MKEVTESTNSNQKNLRNEVIREKENLKRSDRPQENKIEIRKKLFYK